MSVPHSEGDCAFALARTHTNEAVKESAPEAEIAPSHRPNAHDVDLDALRAFDGRAHLDFCWAHWRFSGAHIRD
jgi:hypothetical protein